MNFPIFLSEEQAILWANDFAREFSVSRLIAKHLDEFEKIHQEETEKIFKLLKHGKINNISIEARGTK